MTTYLPYQQRVIDEKVELDEKIAKLEAFLITPTFLDLGINDRILLNRQCDAMRAYSDILGRRIERFMPA